MGNHDNLKKKKSTGYLRLLKIYYFIFIITYYDVCLLRRSFLVLLIFLGFADCTTCTFSFTSLFVIGTTNKFPTFVL